MGKRLSARALERGAEQDVAIARVGRVRFGHEEQAVVLERRDRAECRVAVPRHAHPREASDDAGRVQPAAPDVPLTFDEMVLDSDLAPSAYSKDSRCRIQVSSRGLSIFLVLTNL